MNDRSIEIEATGQAVVDAAVKVHKALGPGLLESAYQQCLAHELTRRGLQVKCEVVLPLVYEGLTIDAGYRIDMVIEDIVLVENKTVENILPIHEAQMLTYLKLSGVHLGYLFNWNVPILKQGIRRMLYRYTPTVKLFGSKQP